MTPAEREQITAYARALVARVDAQRAAATPRPTGRKYEMRPRREERPSRAYVRRQATPRTVAATRQQPRQRSRRSTTARRAAPSSKGASDGPQRFVVTLPPPDPDAVGRLARLIVERAATEVLSRVGSTNSDAAAASTATAPRSKVL